MCAYACVYVCTHVRAHVSERARSKTMEGETTTPRAVETGRFSFWIFLSCISSFLLFFSTVESVRGGFLFFSFFLKERNEKKTKRIEFFKPPSPPVCLHAHTPACIYARKGGHFAGVFCLIARFLSKTLFFRLFSPFPLSLYIQPLFRGLKCLLLRFSLSASFRFVFLVFICSK